MRRQRLDDFAPGERLAIRDRAAKIELSYVKERLEIQGFPELIAEKDKLSRKLAVTIAMFPAAASAWAQSPAPASSPRFPKLVREISGRPN